MSADPRRIRPILEKLAAYWFAHPELRLGQILGNLSPSPTPPDGVFDVYYLPDEELERALVGVLSPTVAGFAHHEVPGLRRQANCRARTFEDGPDAADCACRGTPRQAGCAAAGCGFCRAAS